MSTLFEKPIVFFDLETTGVSVAEDRIVEIYAKKVYPSGQEEEYYQLINPTVAIPVGASNVHGITNDKVANEPTFFDVAQTIYNFFDGCDVGGYNVIRFDIPLLIEEFLRAGLESPFENANVADSMQIFHKMVPRTLAGALRYYKDEELNNAHSAKADVLATIDIYNEQLKTHKELPKTTADIQAYCSNGREVIDYTNYFVKDRSGDIVFNFGKHKNTKVSEQLSYLNWMLGADFPLQTKQTIQKILNNEI